MGESWDSGAGSATAAAEKSAAKVKGFQIMAVRVAKDEANDEAKFRNKRISSPFIAKWGLPLPRCSFDTPAAAFGKLYPGH